MKKSALILLILAIIIIVTISYFLILKNISTNHQEYSEDKITIKVSNETLILKTAITSEERRIGLMNKVSMQENEGMIFIFQEEKQLSFWMKDTLMPLDMIFINSQNIIVDINTAAQPCKESSECTSYISISPSKYVIELNAGRSHELNLEIGQEIDLPFN